MNSINFEQLLNELEEITKKLESGPPLEDMLKLYRRGNEIAELLNKQLNDIKTEFNKLWIHISI